MNKFLAYAVLGLGVMIAFQGLTIYALRADLELTEIERDQYAAKLKGCEQNHKINYEVSDEYQKRLSALDGELRAFKRMYHNTCIPVQRSPGGHHARPSEGEFLESHGINPGALLDFAARAERVRLQLLACQSFIRKSKG